MDSSRYPDLHLPAGLSIVLTHLRNPLTKEHAEWIDETS